MDEEALTTQKVRPSVSKEIQQELVEVFVGPVVIWLLVGTSKESGRSETEPFRSNVETDPVWNWLGGAAGHLRQILEIP